jgi:hypothetical protein
LPYAVLCGAARSALADGTSYAGEAVGDLMIELVELVVLGMVVSIVLAVIVRSVVRGRRKAAAAAQVIPPARVVVARKPR